MRGLDLTSLIISALAVIIGIVVHESAHSLAAYLLGDATSRSRGRLSLNPLNHIDPFGTILLPLLMLAVGGPVFAFAKPVPVYVNNLRHPKRDEVLVSLAGPASNIVLAIAFTGLLGAALGIDASAQTLAVLTTLTRFCSDAIVINLGLAFFNLIPIPPLDGSSILVLLLRGKALRAYYDLQRYAMAALLFVLFVLPTFLHIDLITLYFDATVYPIYDAMISMALSLAGVR